MTLTVASNILPRGRRRRALVGAIVLGAAVAGAAAAVLGGAAHGARLALFVPFWAAALSLLQARDRT